MSDADAFKDADAASYDAVSDEFDRLSQRYATYVIEPLLGLAGLQPSDRVVDIGCGTGLITFEAARRLGDEGHITGIDLSDGMLSHARDRAARLGLQQRVDFLKCDAEALTLPEASIDAVLSLYALRHFPDPLAAIREIHRVLRPGGRISLAVGSAPRLFSAAGLGAALRKLEQALASRRGKLLTSPEQLDRLIEQHLPRANTQDITAWSDHHHEFSQSLEAMVGAAGFASIASTWVGRQYEISDVEEFWSTQATFSSKARKRIAEAGEADLARLRQAFEAECSATLAKGGKLIYRVGARIVSARKPA